MRFCVIIALVAWGYSLFLSADAKFVKEEFKWPKWPPRPDCEYLFGVKRCWTPDEEEKSKYADECALTQRVCGDDLAICTKRRRGFLCECPDGYMPFPSINWRINVTTCKDMDLFIPPKTQDKKGRVDKVLELVKNMTEDRVPLKTVAMLMDALSDDKEEKSKVARRHKILMSKKALISRLVERTNTLHTMNFTTNTTDGEILNVGPNATLKGLMRLKNPLGQVHLDIDLMGIANNNNGSASVTLVVHHDMEDVLEAGLFFSTRNTTKRLLSKVVSATLEEVWDMNLTKPILFTLQHNTPQSFPKGVLSCVYWDEDRWVKRGCKLSKANSTHSVCVCDHLSTFSLVSENFGKTLFGRILDMAMVVSGPVFLVLTILTFIAFWGRPGVVNKPRLNICVCLLIANPIHLLTQNVFLSDQLCASLPGVSCYFYLSAYTWSSIEAVLLLRAIRRRQRVDADVDEAEPSWGLMYLIGYLLPLLVTAVSAGVLPGGYGGPECWPTYEDMSVAAFLGPVFLILMINGVIFTKMVFLIFSVGPAQGQDDWCPTAFRAMGQNLFFGAPWFFSLWRLNPEAMDPGMVTTMESTTFDPSDIEVGEDLEATMEYLERLLLSQMGTLLFISCCILNFKISGPWLAFCHGPSHRVTTTSSPNGNGGFGTGDFSIPGGNGNFIPHNSGDLNAPQQALYNAPQQAPYNAQQASYNAQQVSDLHGQRPSYETLSTQSDFNARFQHHFHHQRPH